MALHLVTLLVLTFALPETRWDRATASSKVDRSSDLQDEKEVIESSTDRLEGSPPTAPQENTASVSTDMHLGKGKPSRQQWHVFQPSLQPLQTLVQAFYVPWKLLTFPIVVFASFIVGFSGSCYLILTFVQSQALGAPPYNFSSQSVGFMNFASLVGAFIGLLTAGSLSDRVSRKLTERNRGIREPEMRLVAMVPYVIIMVLGNFIAGFGLQAGWDWRVRHRSLESCRVSHQSCMLTSGTGYRHHRLWMCRCASGCAPSNRIDLCRGFVQTGGWLDLCGCHDQ